ncbi:MAG: allantoinase AllB [Anaerolineaceae bacterium]|jgi:dihydroorotase|nr:allantoinase AllB [Anaerolineaceae bacterium]
MEVDLIVRNGTIVTSTQESKNAIAIKDGKVLAIDSEENLPAAKATIDAHGNYILPGIIDAHVHFRDPGMTYKEDYQSASLAAAFGGVTLAVDMPNNVPPTDNAAHLLEKTELIRDKSYIDIALFGLIAPENMDRIAELAEAGVAGYKVYMGESFGGLKNLEDGQLIQAFEEVALTGRRIAFHAETNSLLRHYAEKVMKTGRTDPMAFLESRPIICEVDSIQKIALYSKYTGAKVHILHVSSKDGAEAIRDWKAAGVDITSETCPHYMFLPSDQYMDSCKSLLRVNPPVRSIEHGEYLYQALADGEIDFLTTDHAPHSVEEKITEDIWKANSGLLGVETSAQILLSEGVNKRDMPLKRFVEITSEMPAKTWGLWPKKGSLQVGADADITIVDVNKDWKIESDSLHSKHKVTAWQSWEGKGKPVTTIVRGHPIVVDEVFVAKDHVGRFTPRL